MYIYDIIEKKRNKKELTKQEINFVVENFVAKKITDAQMSALLMAIVLNDMTYNETLYLTHAMRDSGDIIKFDEYIVDKHSTGGVSDSTTLILVPLLAALGVKIAKMSGRSLGFTGGTIDKIEVFEGFNASITMKEFKQLISKNNASIISQTDNLAYADKLIYALRNETATVDSIPLIASSIMSKKLASGSSMLMLNVHYGSGAFMKTKKDAIKLAKYMVRIGNDSNIKTMAVVGDMNTPLSYGVGASREVYSVLKAIKGENTVLLKLSKVLAREMLSNAKGITTKEASAMIEKAFEDNLVEAKLKQIITSQGGKIDFIDNLDLFPKSKKTINVYSDLSGYVNKIDALSVARLVNHMQVGTKDEKAKRYVGCDIKVNINDKIKKGDLIAQLYVDTMSKSEEYIADMKNSLKISKFKAKTAKIYDKIIK